MTVALEKGLHDLDLGLAPLGEPGHQSRVEAANGLRRLGHLLFHLMVGP